MRWLATLCVLSLSPIGYSQGSLSDYRRAENYSSWVRGKVIGERVDANWIDGGRALWARVPTGPDSHRFVLVDNAQGERRDLFDHQHLADALASATDKTLDADRLPLRGVTLGEENALRFRFGGKNWRWEMASRQLSKDAKPNSANGTTVEVLGDVRRSGASSEETSILFVNQTDDQVALLWVSPDGQRRGYTELSPGREHQQHTYGGHVWMATDAGGKTLGVYRATKSPGVAVVDGNWRPARERGRDRSQNRGKGVSPDGRWRVAIEDHNVVLHNLGAADGEDPVARLTTDGASQDRYLPRFFWSPDSSKLVVLRERPVEPRKVQFIESSPKDQLQPRLRTIDYPKPGDPLPKMRVALFDIQQQKAVEVSDELFDNPWSLSNFAWKDDSSEFLFLYNQRGHQLLRLVGVNAATGHTRALIDETSDTFVCYSSKTYLRLLEGGHAALWMSERDGWNHLYLCDLRTGEVTNQITQGEWVVRGVERVDEEKGLVWFTAGGVRPHQDPYHKHYCRINLDGSGLVILTAGDGTHDIEYSPEGEYFLDRYSRVDLPPVTEVRRAEDGSLVAELCRAEWSPLLAAGWRPPLRFVAKARDGHTDIHGVIYRPSTFDPNKKYPVVEHIYAGPHSAHVPKRFSAQQKGQDLAELGFVVVQIDGMGTSHRSKQFHDVCWRNLADAGFPDRVLWIKAAAEEHAWIDATRVGIYGGSAGGQSAVRALIDHGDFYDAAVADCGCHDNRMDKIWWNEQWMGWPVGKHYARSSNVEHAHRITGELLLTVGEVDSNVDPASTMQVVDALIKADKDFELIVFPGSGHGAGGSAYGTRRMRDFFASRLLSVSPRWE